MPDWWTCKLDTTLILRDSVTATDLNQTAIGSLRAKDGHSYLRTMVFPLIGSTFEQVHAFIPNNAEAVLTQEHGTEALARKDFEGS